jgi:hypothetical protein
MANSRAYMKKYIFFFFLAILCLVYVYQKIGDRSDEERLSVAESTFKDYLFESRIDSKFFTGPVIEDKFNGTKSYRWEAVIPDNKSIGVEVRVAKSKSIEPELSLSGKANDLFGLFGTAPDPPENAIYNWFFWRH